MADNNPFAIENLPPIAPAKQNPFSVEVIEAEQAHSALSSSLDKNPDQAAQALRLSQSTGTPMDAVESNLSQVSNVQKLDDYSRLLQDAPRTRKFFTTPANAAVAHDNLPNMRAIERTLLERESDLLASDMPASLKMGRMFQELLPDAWNRGVPLGKKASADLLQGLGVFDGLEKRKAEATKAGGVDFTPGLDHAIYLKNLQRQSDAFPMPDDLARAQEEYGNAKTFGESFSVMKRNPGLIMDTVLQSAAIGAPTLAMAGAASLVPGFWPMAGTVALGSFMTEYGSSISDYMNDQKIDTNDPIAVAHAYSDPAFMDGARAFATERGLPVAVFDGLTAGFGGKLLKGITKVSKPQAAARVAGELGINAGGGAAGEQSAQWITGQDKPGDVLMEAIAELPTGVVEMPGNFYRSMRYAEQAETQAKQVELLNNLAASDKVLQRDTQTFEAFVKDASQDGPTNQVFISANALMQSGMAEKIAELSPSVAEQLPLAQNTGGVISIPTDEYMAKIAPTEFSAPLVDHLKFDPEGYSRAEAIEFLQNGYEALANEMAQALNKHQVDEDFQRSKAALRQRFISELNAVGKHPSAVNHAYGTFLAEYFATNAADLGVSPEELHNQYAVKFAQGRTTDSYDQAGNLQTNTENFKNWFGNSKVVDAEGSPLVVYHGTADDVGSFDLDHPNRHDSGWLGKGVYTTTSSEIASSYSYIKAGMGDPNVMPLYVSLQNPYLATIADKQRLQAISHNQGKAAGQVAAEHWANELKAQGYDGVILEYPESMVGKSQASKEIVVFDPTKIKSATGNNGNFDPNNPDILMQGAKKEGRNAITGDLSRLEKDDPAAYQAIQNVLARMPESDRARLLDKLEENKGTPWAAVAVKSFLLREIIHLSEDPVGNREAIEAIASGHVWGKDNILRYEMFRDVFMATRNREAKIKKFAQGYNFITPNRKAELDVSGSFLNCNPSPDCASNCYSANGQTAAPAALMRSEFTEYMATHFPDILSEQIARDFATSVPGQEGLKLRINDKGDLSAEQVVLVKRLNAEGIAMQVFSKRPELLRELDDMNLKMLSVDGSSIELARANPDLKLAVVITEGITEDVVLEFADRTQVWFPVNYKGAEYTKGDIKKMFPNAFSKISKHICPVEGTSLKASPGVSFVDVVMKTDVGAGNWTCTTCDKLGTACFFDAKTKEEGQKKVEQYVSVTSIGNRAKQKQIEREIAKTIKTLTTLKDLGQIDGQQFSAILSQLTGASSDVFLNDDAQATGGSAQEDSTSGGGEGTGGTGIGRDGAGGQYHQSARGAFDPSTLTIALLEHADLSTFLHETGHFFLEMQFDLAAKLRGEADVFGMDSLRPGEQRIVNDTQAILDWFGIPDINTWYSLDLEQKRPYHEQFARGFEKYLFEGKAPSIELQSLFKKFADWLKKVYKTITEFGDVKLTPEVRGVFDRMLASEEQIHLAEQARSMMPLLEALDKAPMSVDDFERYQRENAEATDEAITELTRRTLGDMKWLRNAKSKALKELQKDSREKRREVRMAVRAEVMSMPIYRAWTLLTAKQGPDNKIIPRPKSSPEHVNPEVDNLFVAIAKLGGLNKQELIEEWGIDPAYKPQSGIFGKPVFRAKDGGLSREAMAELLVDHGYLTGDQYGKHDLREFEEKLDDQLRGTDQFSVMHDYSDLLDSRTGDHVNLSSLTVVRFDLGELRVAGLPDDVIKALEDRRMTSKTNGIHQDFVRDMILDEDGNPAFSSGDELARALATAEKPHEVIESLTDVRMLEEYGDIATPEALAQAADLAVLNRFRIKFATTQANALAAATGQRRVLEAAAKQLADTTVGRTLVRYLNPNKYLSAQARAAKAAADHLKKNDVTNAAAESRNQVFNMMAARAAMEARDEIKKIDQFFKKVVSGKDAEEGKSRDLDIVNAARAALRRFGYGHKAKTADAYLENVGKYDPELHQVLMGVVGQVDALANSIGSTNQTLTIKDLTVDQLRSLREDIDLLWNQAKRNHEIEVDGKMVNRQFAIDALQEQLSSLGLPESTVGQFHGVTDKEKVAMGIASTVALGKRVEFYIDWLDGGKQMGAFRTFIWNMIKDPATAYRAENARLLRTFRELFDDVKDTFKPILITAPELGGYTFGEVGGGVALNEILHAIAHTGNNSNKRKLLLGRGWATQRPDGSLDTTHWDAFVSRLIKEGVLTKAHFDFVQGIWDLLESTKPAAQKAHREAYGKYFDEVTANAFMTPFGEYRGGYIPATVDSDQVKDMELKKLIEAGKDGMAYAFPTTNFGSRFSRVEYNRPLLLDLRTLPQHLNKVLLFSHMEMPGRDVRKLLASKEVGGLLNKVDPSAMNAMLMPWLTRSVKQQVSTPQAGLAPINKFASMIRSRVVMASMFMNVSNAAQQITGLFPAAHEVGAHRLADSMALYVKDPKAFTANIAELSPMMASRMDDEISAMMDEVNQILLNPDLTKSAQNWSHRHIFFLQSAVDNIVSPIVWRSAFDKALAEDFNVKDAVRIADSVVRKTQGSSQAEDISRFESGPAYARLLTVFSGFFLMQAGWLGSKLGVLMQQGGLRKNAGRAFMIYTLGFAAPMIVSEAISQAMRGGPDDEDKDGTYLDDWLQAVFVTGQIRGATAMVPIVGPAVNSAFARFNNNPMDDRLNISPVVTAIEGSVAVPYDLYQNMAGKGNAQRTIRDVGTLMTLFSGMPFSTAAKPIGYVAGVAQGKIEPTGPVDFTRGLITGVASPESKQR